MTTAWFDADCAFCSRCARWLQGPVFRTRATLTPLQVADLAAHDVTLEQATAEMHAVADDGAVVSGHLAWAAVLRASRQPWPWVGRLLALPVAAPLASAGYRLVAANRHRLPGGSPSCTIPQP